MKEARQEKWQRAENGARRSDKKGLRIGQLGGTGPANNYRNWVEPGILSSWPSTLLQLDGKLVAITNTDNEAGLRCQILAIASNKKWNSAPSCKRYRERIDCVCMCGHRWPEILESNPD